MGIFVTIEDKDGDLISQSIYIQSLQKYFRKMEQGVCLRFIYEDEDTAFNSYQLASLKNELKQLEAMGLEPQEKEELNQLTALVGKISGKAHTYLKFYGEARPE